ncbi:LIM-type zinc finger-containing protein [Dictyostelium discoideum AX4]|uniref:LIM domain-containing protein C n=1 Tax=Dictyostelium discoideum TaxID=44689 RepID=LIMC_DICDI|nr:LIM-type zinc finger-containing protein [Dictyostelium discoideum AX4]Q9BIW5.1 RecName: Full=LIM domain-containing protein C [Dictyostelium discoideum]AAK30152.1 LimC [Dictyostelium discoideum]EAL68113.1 LIM-type zinc finger-containing protein [Dictyostelium discoideum AX4]|eukprot:XP_642140.1 LIM-type zinc finger-containing protein [Dictyostelium discoideum AX4]
MSSICPTCTKRVYAAEAVKACEKQYHKLCLQCFHCHKILQLGQYSERDGQPYCKTDYDRLFRQAGYRGGGVVADSFEPAPKVETTTPVEPTPPPTFLTPTEEVKVQLFPTNCPKCGKKAYFNELKVYNSRDWHKTCFACFSCNKNLVSGQYSEKEGLIYCPRCYQSKFGPSGYTNTGALVLH